jgi:hypothetical protein
MSIINPKKLQYYGVTVSDDPTDRTRAFGITAENGGVHVPFKMDGTTVCFETRVPTQYELENCKLIQQTKETVWEASSVIIASVTVTSDLPIIKISERRKISVMIVKSNNVLPPTAKSSHDLMPYDNAAFLNRKIGNVRVATAFL